MELGELKKHIESFDSGHKFEYSLSYPFSSRGSYNEVTFEILKSPMTREEVLANIEKAYTETFFGYKRGEYTYSEILM